jgi:pyruvate dehydrogenase E1 component alpha subunit
VDGNNVLEVYEKAGEAVRRARAGEGPTLIECLTYRWYGHHEGDPGVAYRSKEEIAEWKGRDPIATLREDALKAGTASDADFSKIDQEIQAELEEATEFALSSPLEADSTALKHVYYESSAQ